MGTLTDRADFLTDDGASIAYLEAGSGQPIVFIHGFTLDRTLWQYVVENPPAGCRLIMYDLRGHGMSGSLPPDYSKARLLADLEAIVKATSSADTILCSHSLGCSAAVEYALRHPGRARALVLVNPYVSGCARPPESIWNRGAVSFSEIAKTQGIDEAKKRWENFALFDPARRRPAAAKLLRDMIARFSGAPWLYETRDERAALNTRDLLNNLRCPVLAISGAEDDILYRQAAEFVRSVVPKSSLVVIRDAGHLVPIEQPQAFCDALSRFVGALDGPRSEVVR
jgi:pimeloyl-ACP methyl ester carboxylesterase